MFAQVSNRNEYIGLLHTAPSAHPNIFFNNSYDRYDILFVSRVIHNIVFHSHSPDQRQPVMRPCLRGKRQQTRTSFSCFVVGASFFFCFCHTKWIHMRAPTIPISPLYSCGNLIKCLICFFYSEVDAWVRIWLTWDVSWVCVWVCLLNANIGCDVVNFEN